MAVKECLLEEEVWFHFVSYSAKKYNINHYNNLISSGPQGG